MVAFYTDEIITKAGPESFNGLPGMILGLAIPHQHITIFATSVTGFDTAPSQWKLPVQGKNIPTNNKEFNVVTSKMLKDFNLTSPGYSSLWICNGISCRNATLLYRFFRLLKNIQKKEIIMAC
ncbi:GLPGLI family protein [Niabella defluvii]|nr:GLPGLI family protein [Niabella sp. I65]